MPIVLRFDGVNDYVSTPSFTLNTGATVEVRFRILTNQTFSWLSAGPTATNAFIRWNGTTLRARGNQTGPNVNVPNGINIADGEFHTVQLIIGATTHRFNVDGFDTADLTGDVSTNMHDTIGAFFNSYFDGDIEYLEISNNGSDNRRWDANQSTTGPGPTILTETVAGSNGTGVNFPTDGSQWIDTGGGGVSLSVDNLEQAQAISEPLLIQANVLSVDPITSEQSISNVSLQVQGSLDVDNLSNEQGIGNVNLQVQSVLSVNDISNEQALSNVTLQVQGALNVDSLSNEQSLSNIDLNQNNVLIVQNISNQQSIDNVELAFNIGLSVDGLLQGQELSNGDLVVGDNLIVQPLEQSQVIDNVELTQQYVLITNSLTQNQFLGNVILNGQDQTIGTVTAAFKDSGIGVKYGVAKFTVKFKD